MKKRRLKTKLKLKTSFAEKLFQTLNYIFAGLFGLICIYPFYYILLYSLSNPELASKGNIIFVPDGFTLENYIRILTSEGMGSAFIVSLSRSLLGTSITVLVTGLFAYLMTKKEVPMRKFFYRATIASMYINAGIIPWYITMLKLGLKNNFLLYILPAVINAYFLILIKTYIESIPPSLEESAHIDGAGLFTVYFKILLPVCKPILAAVAVFSAVWQWNAWTDTFYLVNEPSLFTFQYKLVIMLREAEIIAKQMQFSPSSVSLEALKTRITPMSIRMTTSMVVAIPIILVYPALQKYFVKGIMMGAIKG